MRVAFYGSGATAKREGHTPHAGCSLSSTDDWGRLRVEDSTQVQGDDVRDNYHEPSDATAR